MRAVMQAAHHEDKFAFMAKQMGKWVDQVFRPGFHKFSSGEAWVPAVNIYESDAGYCVVVDLAGVKAEEIELSARDNKLTVSGYREAPCMVKEAKQIRLHHMEIDHGKFCRSLELPEDVDMDRVEANYKSGFLWIHVPKRS